MIPVKFLSLLALILPIAAQNSHMYLKEKLNYYSKETKGFKHVIPEHPGDKAENDGSYRLSTAIEPLSYFVRLQPFINGDRSVLGYSEIVFYTLEETDMLNLHMLDIELYYASFLLEILDGSGETVDFTHHSYNSSTQIYKRYLASPLPANNEYRLSFDFEGIVNLGYDGFYQSSYTNEDGEKVLLGTTQFQPTSARRAFPCFDEPSLKATFQIEMGRENSYGAISNTPVISSRPIEAFEGWTWDLFDVTPVMSSYLVAFVVSDFVKISTVSETGVEFNTWSRPELIQFGEYSLNVSPRISTAFEQYFDIPYPLPKQDQIAIPDFSAGAMENWGLVTYREEALLWDPVLGTTRDKRAVAKIIGHELAHMWLGNLVTAEWWGHLWLNEGFASYYESVGTDAAEPDMDTLIEFVHETLQYTLRVDDNPSSLPVIRDVETPSEIGGMFNAMTYSKGGVLVRMMENFLTYDTFRVGMQNYLNANAYDNALQDNLFHHLNEQGHLDGTLKAPLNVKEIMDTWTLQPGFPLITVTINGDGTALLTQERYLRTPNSDSSEKYWVPISYASDTINTEFNSAPIVWMSPTDSSLTITGLSPSSTWHIFNIQQAYFYRVNYDDSTWNGIADHLADDYSAVDTRNRAQLLDDSFTFAKEGLLSFEIPFSIASYLNNEDHFVPWKSYLSNVRYIEQMFSRTVAYAGLRKYLRRILYPAYDLVGAVDNAENEDRTLFLRNEIVPWACDMLYDPCLESASHQFGIWMSNPDDYSIISPNLKSEVYCTAISQGNEKEWNFALDRYQTTTLSEEKSFLLFAMACSQDVVTLMAYIDLIYNGNEEIPQSSAYTAFSHIASTDTGRDIAWDYLVNNYNAIAHFHESYDTVQNLAGKASKEFNTQKDLAEITAFRDHLKSEGHDVSILESAIGTVKYNIAWLEENYDTIANWLYTNGYEWV